MSSIILFYIIMLFVSMLTKAKTPKDEKSFGVSGEVFYIPYLPVDISLNSGISG